MTETGYIDRMVCIGFIKKSEITVNLVIYNNIRHTTTINFLQPETRRADEK